MSYPLDYKGEMNPPSGKEQLVGVLSRLVLGLGEEKQQCSKAPLLLPRRGTKWIRSDSNRRVGVLINLASSILGQAWPVSTSRFTFGNVARLPHLA